MECSWCCPEWLSGINSESIDEVKLIDEVKFCFIIMLGYMLPRWHCASSLSWDTRLCPINLILLIYLPPTTVVYWPPTRPNMPFQRQWKCIFHWRGRARLSIWDRVKIPRYSHKLIYRKRVTCELHDSYFRSMTIKHAIPNTAEVHIPMASYGEILSYITQCTGTSESLGIRIVGEMRL